MVAALGNGERPADRLLHPGPQALAHPVDLDAGVVDVELARHLVPAPFEERGDAVAQGGAAAVPDVQGAGRVGGDELHVDPDAAADVGATVARARLDDGAQRGGQLRRARARS